ncbi:response regulator transcription factor [Thermosynechococcus sp. B0]|uniref:two-component system response regulator RppA n=1 Tax=unclassified Thermosynechococcus TaxID=2622553 RepID=UPI0025781E60|nr:MULTISPECIES: two-component system response regulator RppA [unclassified Thermosynechococcus]WJI23134.1 response regulator transcription factor [Thermosynechococcus sp. B0]WJI25649.1 response regulator transcription factor [Thermosynechococcus sp. B1]WJI28178.1 response regulator transcription factor [Thermosynechococcus sp. B3]
MKVLLLEDEPDLGAAIQRVLQREGYVVDWAQEGELVWAYIEQLQVDYSVAILDWMVPRLSGLEVCQRLRIHHYTVPILLLTARDGLSDRVQGLDAGADDYLIKPFAMAELLARLRALLRRSPQFQPQQLCQGALTLDYGTFTLRNRAGTEVQLTAKEFQTLEYLMKRPQRILSSDQLMMQLWEVGSEPSSNVVAAQIRLLRRKLALLGQEHCIETVHGLGYRFVVDHG